MRPGAPVRGSLVEAAASITPQTGAQVLRQALAEAGARDLWRAARRAGLRHVPPSVARLAPIARRVFPMARYIDLLDWLMAEAAEEEATRAAAAPYLGGGWILHRQCQLGGSLVSYQTKAVATAPDSGYGSYTWYADGCQFISGSHPSWPPTVAALSGRNHLLAHRDWKPVYIWETNRRGGLYWYRPWANRNDPAQAGFLPIRTDHGAKGPLLGLLRGIAPHVDVPPGPAAGPAPRHLGMRARAARDRLARRGLLPFRPPGLPRQAGSVPRGTRTAWRPGETDLVVESPAPGLRPQPWPVREVPTTHRFERPARGTRERKVAVRGPIATVYRLVGRVFGQVTEGGDLVDALWEALPQEVRRRAAGAERRGVNPLWWKLEDLWEHWREMDAAQAVANVIANQIEDAIIGRSQQWMNRRSALITDSPVMGLGTRVTRGREDVYGGVSAGVSYARDQALAAWREW